MGPDPFYLDRLVPEAEPCDKPVFVSLDIKDHPIIANHISGGIGFLHLIEVTPFSPPAYLVPGFQWVFRIGMNCIKLRQGPPTDYIHNVKITKKVGILPTLNKWPV